LSAFIGPGAGADSSLHHLHDHAGGLFQHRRARREVDVFQAMAGERVAVGEAFACLGILYSAEASDSMSSRRSA
jgi:hypothetical protein